MDYAMIGKIEKAKMYAEERAQRIAFESFRVRINGDNDSHYVEYNSGNWQCDCEFFASRGHCSHTMAMERVLENMVELAS